jgi:hypothetical protein
MMVFKDEVGTGWYVSPVGQVARTRTDSRWLWLRNKWRFRKSPVRKVGGAWMPASHPDPIPLRALFDPDTQQPVEATEEYSPPNSALL